MSEDDDKIERENIALTSELESNIWTAIHEWHQNHDVNVEKKRHALGLILLRVIGCVLAMEGDEEKVKEIVNQFINEIPKAVHLGYSKAIPNPINYLEEK